MKKILLCILLSMLNVYSSDSQWQQVYSGSSAFRSLVSFDNVIYGGRNGGGITISTNNGANWMNTMSNLTVWGFAKIGSSIFAGASQFGVYVSTNNGLNWTQTSLNDKDVRSLAAMGNDLYAGIDPYGVMKSTNNGVNWTQTSLNNITVVSLNVSGSYLFAGPNSNTLRYTTNSGNNWFGSSLSGSIQTLSSMGSYVFAGLSQYGIYVSSNLGNTWSHSTYDSGTVFSSTITGNTIFAGTYNGVIVSNDNGATWTRKVEGMPANIIDSRAICIHNNFVYAYGYSSPNHYVYKRPVSELTGINQVSGTVPGEFSLSQNYPNPFNPVTNIEFSVPKSAFVKLTIFDITGRELETLLNQDMTPGTYKAEWDASKYSSGVYFYSIEAGEYRMIRKMMLVK